jgi:cytochrome c-type biogenesis protein CcsB
MASWSQGLFIMALVVNGITTVIWVISIFFKHSCHYALGAMLAVFILLNLSIIIRTVATGHGPFSNMYEFSLAFAWGILAVGLIFWWRKRVALIAAIATVLGLGILIFASTLSSKEIPLVPALQQSTLLTLHVTAAVVAYGSFSVSFGVAIVYLFRQSKPVSRWPAAETLDHIGYQAVIIGFPFLTLTIILGAVWADISWGRYWGWDPKETASFVTWLFYAGYLHTRLMRGWRGKKLAMILVVGFCAVLFTFFGNYVFQGLHSYR